MSSVTSHATMQLMYAARRFLSQGCVVSVAYLDPKKMVRNSNFSELALSLYYNLRKLDALSVFMHTALQISYVYTMHLSCYSV